MAAPSVYRGAVVGARVMGDTIIVSDQVVVDGGGLPGQSPA
jgi:hypothetical protein